MLDVILLYGPPTAGKGTVAKKFDDKNVISTGNILREMQLAKLDGTLVDDLTVNKVLINELSNRADAGFVLLDGYPRRAKQAEFLGYLEQVGIIRIKNFIELHCSDEMVLDRSCNRLSCDCGASYHPTLKPSKVENECDLCQSELYRRADDAPETVKQRLEIFNSQTCEILPYFQRIRHSINVEDGLNVALSEALGVISASLNKSLIIKGKTLKTSLVRSGCKSKD